MSLKPKLNKEVAVPAPEISKKQSFSGIALESVPRMFCPKCEQKINTSTAKALSEGKCPSCGDTIIVHGKVGPYRVLKLIGQGGMGAVYEGFDEGLGRKVAIKVTLMDVTRDKNMMETFQREAQVVAQLNHPNIVQVYAFGVEDGHPYLVMELLPSGSLLERIEVEGSLDSPFLMGVAMEVASGLNAAQEAGLLHGDIKPENILFDDKMHAKLVDFGLAALSSSVTKNEVWGTPYYIAPEKVTERKSNHKCDIYSLGATLYHAYTKRPPFEGVDGTEVVKACIEKQAKPLSEVRPDIEPEVAAIISRMMEKDVSLRYPNYKSIIADIKKFLSTVPVARLSRTSRIVTFGMKKTTGAKKIFLQRSVSEKMTVASNQPMSPLETMSAEAKPSGYFKKPMLVAVLVAACVVVAGVAAGRIIKKPLSGETKPQLFANMQKVDEQCSKVVTFAQSSYLKIEQRNGEAQKMVSAFQKNRDNILQANAAIIQHAEDVQALGKKIQVLCCKAELLRTQAGQAKLAPCTINSVDMAQLTQRRKELNARLEMGKALKEMDEEAESLFAEMKNKWAVVENTFLGAQ